MTKYNFLLTFLFLSVFTLGFSACDDDDDTQAPQNIAEIVAADDNFSILLTALQQTNLDGVLTGDGPFTVFAPTNAAFTDAGIDLATISNEDLTEVLLYHVLSGLEIPSNALAIGQTYASTATTTGPGVNGLSILIERAGTSVTVNGDANVTQADIDASNGVVHVIDKVLMPLDIVGHAQANDNFSSLVSALAAADGDLVDLLSGDGPFTVFAPLNSAFAEIQETVDGLDSDQLAKVLTYHVVAGTNLRSDALTLGEVTTANDDETFEVTSLSPAEITDDAGNTTAIVGFDVQATNGVIHVLDGVLIPDNL